MTSSTTDNLLTVALAQISPVWLNRIATLDKILSSVNEAADKQAQLVVFGESLLPGYPFWLERTGGAEFNSPKQKEFHALYLDQAVNIEAGDLSDLCRLAKQRSIAVILGTAERATDRGGHSIYCSLVHINQTGEIINIHRKLMPTYEERLTWSIGDGHGLRTSALGSFTVGALNCWENWMPLARAALYAQGEDLHVAIWPGGFHNTHDITRFIAKESRSYVLSVSALMRPSDFPDSTPHLTELLDNAPDYFANGGTCVSAPDGEWLLEPQCDKEAVFVVSLDHAKVLQEKQNFDPVGHYSRPDVTQLHINRERQSTLKVSD